MILPQKEIYTYNAPWLIYGLSWTNDSISNFRLACGSFIEDKSNKIQVVDLDGETNQLVCAAEIGQIYPSSKIMWAPKKAPNTNLLAASGESLKIYEYDREHRQIESKSVLSQSKNLEFAAPLTSFDWNELDPTIIATSSIDTTCAVWNIQTGQIKTQLIAHDKEVNDISFGRSVDVFGTAGADGSVRLFDLRSLEHSTILYETPNLSPILRLMWNKVDPNYIAAISAFTESVTILDVRMPSCTMSELKGHRKFVSHCAWSPKSANTICTVGEDGQALVWNIAIGQKSHDEPALAYNANDDICQVAWSNVATEWVAITLKSTIQALLI